MAAPAPKRRKVEQDASDDQQDDGSFASFGESQEEEEEQYNGPDEDEHNSTEESLMDVDEDVDDGHFDGNINNKPGVQNSSNNDRPPSTAHHRKVVGRKDGRGVDSGSSPYVAGNHKSTLLKLQVDELLEQIPTRHGKKEIQAEEVLHRLKTAIENIPEAGPLEIHEAEKQHLASGKIQIPFPNPRPPKDAKYKLEYAKPTNVNVVGSHVLKTASRSKKNVEIDMVVTMPSRLFQDKDYLDFRYFYKRAYYIASIAGGLKAAFGNELNFTFQCFHDDTLKAILVATPTVKSAGDAAQKSSSKWQINIVLCIAENTFQADKLGPDKCCVRSQAQSPNAEAKSKEPRAPTAFYNSSLRSDMLAPSYLKLLNAARKTCDSFRDACLLGNTWLRQRGFASDIRAGGFGNFEWSALMAGLLQGGGPGGRPILSEGYSSYQLFKATLQLLAMRDFCKQPLVISTDGEAPKFNSSSQPIVWDASRKHNLLYKAAPWSYRLLRREARTTLSVLGDQQYDGFDATFILRTDGVLYRYDYTLEMDVEVCSKRNSNSKYDPVGSYHHLYDVLQKGLGNRANLVNIMPSGTSSWPLDSSESTGPERSRLMIGIMTNADNAGRLIDHGPAAEEKSEAAAFREFWGNKAELRRFKDGSIQETLVWWGKESDPPVVEQIIRHVMQRHFGRQAEQEVVFFRHEFRKLLPAGSGRSAFEPLMDAFKQLETDIRSLEGLPLVVRQIMPSDPRLRYASIRAPSQTHSELPASVVIQFEGSARWPDDLVAIQRTKIAFLLRLREQLSESVDSATARLGLENEEHDILNQGFLDFIYDYGAAFRLRIHHDREQTLLERILKDKTLDPTTKQMAAHGLAAYKRDYIKAPSHTQAVARLCGRYPAMSGTIRLLKKWFASHLLANDIAEEIIELVAIKSFTQPWPWEAPASVQTGFLRTVFWLSRWDWKAEPLIVDISGSGELKPSDIQSVQTQFEAWRKLDPAMSRVVLFAASNVDRDGTTWTDGHPAKVVAGRMTALARAACAEITEKQLHLASTTLFDSSIGDFDIIIRFDPVAVGRKQHRKRPGTNGVTFKNLELDLISDTSRVGLDSFNSFLKELEDLYGSAILLFSGWPEKPIIAGLWNPQTARRPWKLNLSYSTTPIKDTAGAEIKADVNKESILAEIARLGGDMIQSIEVNR